MIISTSYPIIQALAVIIDNKQAKWAMKFNPMLLKGKK